MPGGSNPIGGQPHVNPNYNAHPSTPAAKSGAAPAGNKGQPTYQQAMDEHIGKIKQGNENLKNLQAEKAQLKEKKAENLTSMHKNIVQSGKLQDAINEGEKVIDKKTARIAAIKAEQARRAAEKAKQNS